ncbi:MAG: hypothetical protein ACTSO9_06035 [Candidatus Helarchaeota archaeon]
MVDLYDIYVIYKGGQTIFHKNFSTVKVDPDLVTAFLTAVTNFSQEVLPTGDPLRIIEKGYSKIIMAYEKIIMTALICGSNNPDDVQLLKERIDIIIKELQTKYQSTLQNWAGKVSDFMGMGEVIDDHLKDILRISVPPTLEFMLMNPEKFSFSIDERGLNLYNAYLRDNRGFLTFLEKLGLKIAWIDKILNVLKNQSLTLKSLSNNIDLDLNITTVVMRDLKLRGLVLMTL